MKALSLTQPWATLVAIGAKRWETRSWAMSYRGEIAIQAAKNYPVGCRELEYQIPFAQYLAAEGPLPLGKIIAIAHITECRRSEEFFSQGSTGPASARGVIISPEEFAFGDFSADRFAFKIERVRRITPIDCRGALGLWSVPDDIVARIQFLDEVPV